MRPPCESALKRPPALLCCYPLVVSPLVTVSTSMPVQNVATATYPRWAVALHFDEVVIVKSPFIVLRVISYKGLPIFSVSKVVGIDERRNEAEVQIFTLTANRYFWPYMQQNVFHLPCSSLLHYLPRDQQPTSVPCFTDSRSLKQRQPVNLPTASWDSFMDIRDAHHARLKDRSLAARKQERRDEREHDYIMSHE
jgi:hypothetical protein